MTTVEASGATFPARLDELTPGWVDAALHAAGALPPSDHVVGLAPELLGEGYGLLGQLARLHLEHRGPSTAMPSVIFKCATPTVGNRAVATAFDMYNRELSFYRLLAPAVGSLAPACYRSDYDPATGDFALLLEDLCDHRRGDQAAGCGLADAEVLVDTLSALHATWWDRTDGPELAWVPRPDGAMYKVGMVAGVEAGWAPTMALFGHLLDPELAAAGDRYIAALPSLHDRMAGGHQTFLHGDFRLDNLMFGSEPERPVVLVDWQGCIVSKGAQDLAYLLTQNVTTDVRRSHEAALVERYHASLSARGVAGYSLDECWDDYCLAALWLWEYAIVIAGTLDPANERGTAFMAGLVQRAAAAITDLRLLDRLG